MYINLFKEIADINDIIIYLYLGGSTMSIAPIDSNINTGSGYSSINGNNYIKMLEKQKMQLKEQIQKVSESKMDTKMKQEKVEELNKQIVEIEAQIRIKRMEEMKPDFKNADSENKDKFEDNKAQDEQFDSGINSKHMISAVNGYSDLKVLGKVRTELKAKLRIATHSGENPEAGKGIQKQIDEIEYNMQKKAEKINSDLRKVAKEGEKKEKQVTQEDEKEDNKSIQNDIKNADSDNSLTITGNAESQQDENKGLALNDGKKPDKTSNNKVKESVPVHRKTVDIRV